MNHQLKSDYFRIEMKFTFQVSLQGVGLKSDYFRIEMS